jgi:hypothetical protein
MTDFESFQDDKDHPGPDDYDWTKPSKAVVVQGTGGGCVLFTAGPHVASMINEAGVSDLDNLGLDDAPDGVSIWEGGIKSVHHNTPDANEHEWWLEGAFREPTDEEWESIRKNDCPWDDNEWRAPPKAAP